MPTTALRCCLPPITTPSVWKCRGGRIGGAYRYGFNGKENDRSNFGLQLVQDYGFRLYNPALGKFLSVDPIAKQYPELTPYQFASNTPINSIDLDGLEKHEIIDAFDWAAKKTGHLVVETAKGVGNLIVHPIDGGVAVGKYLYQGASDVGVMGSTWGKIVYGQATGNTAQIDQGAFDESAHRLAKGIVKVASLSIVGTGAAPAVRSVAKVFKKGGGAITEGAGAVGAVEAENAVVYRTQGGVMPNASRHRISFRENGSIQVKGKEMLYVTIDDLAHQVYFYEKRGGNVTGTAIYSFEIPKSLLDDIKNSAVPQNLGKKFPNSPQISDPTKSSGAYGLPGNFIDKIKNQAIKGSGKIIEPNN